MSELSGHMSREPFAYFDPDSSCWRMSQPSLPLENLPEPSVTFPRSGMTRNGLAYELPMSVPPMAEPESSSLPPEEIHIIQDAYAAGLIDGEGCLHLNPSGRNRAAWTAKLTVNMAVGALPVLRAMQETYGGGLCQLRAQTEKTQEVWLWSLTAKAELKALLIAIRPYLMVKHRQADVLLEFLETLDAAPRNGNGSVRWDQAMKSIGRTTKAQITTLNARGAAANALLPTPLNSDAGPRGGTTGYGLRDWSRSLLPTPTVSDGNGAGPHGTGGTDLRTEISLLSTPTASDGEKGGPNQRGSAGDLMLPSAVQSLLPTPRATRGGSATETMALLPTPTSQAAKHSADDRGAGTLDDFNLWAIATRIGEPTNPRLDDGNLFSDD